MVPKTNEMEAGARLRSFDTLSLEVKIKYAVLFAGLSLTTVLSLSYAFFSPPPNLSPNDVIKNIILIVSAGVGLTTLVYTALSINAIRADKVKDTHIAKLIHSSQIVSVWYSPSMTCNTAKILGYAIKLINAKDTAEKERLTREIHDNHDLYVSACSILNFLEHMAQEIGFNLVDEDYLKTFFRHILHFYYHSFSALMLKVRDDAKSINPGCELEALEKRWGSS